MARWTSSSLRPQINTRAPSRTYAEAIARPIPRLPPLTNATFPSNLSAPLLAIDESLYHSHVSHEIIEDASVLVDFLVVDFGADLRDQPVDGARRGLGCRTLARAAVGARSLLARIQPGVHDCRHHRVYFRSPCHFSGPAENAVIGQIGEQLAKLIDGLGIGGCLHRALSDAHERR